MGYLKARILSYHSKPPNIHSCGTTSSQSFIRASGGFFVVFLITFLFFKILLYHIQRGLNVPCFGTDVFLQPKKEAAVFLDLG